MQAHSDPISGNHHIRIGSARRLHFGIGNAFRIGQDGQRGFTETTSSSGGDCERLEPVPRPEGSVLDRRAAMDGWLRSVLPPHRVIETGSPPAGIHRAVSIGYTIVQSTNFHLSDLISWGFGGVPCRSKSSLSRRVPIRSTHQAIAMLAMRGRSQARQLWPLPIPNSCSGGAPP
jgi:hypothetical protein